MSYGMHDMLGIDVSTTKQIGLGLTAFGVFFFTLGILLFLDPALLAMGNLLFIVGITFLIGGRRTLAFFFERRKIKGSSLFFGGVLTVLFGWPLIGILFEIAGFISLFGGFIPGIWQLVRTLPGVSSINKMFEDAEPHKFPV